jgi:hypothetical protein
MLVAPFWGGTALLAQSPPPAAGLQKGAVEVGAIFGTTLPVSWLRAHADRRLTMGSLDIGRLMTHQRGSGPLAGQFEFLLELTPFFAVEQPARTMGFTVSPLHMRWNFAGSPGHPVRPFAEASGGIVYTSDPVPVRTTTFNFIDQAGFGVRIGNGRPWWLAGYRFQHISNAGRVKPNPGANFNFAYVGVSFHR